MPSIALVPITLSVIWRRRSFSSSEMRAIALASTVILLLVGDSMDKPRDDLSGVLGFALKEQMKPGDGRDFNRRHYSLHLFEAGFWHQSILLRLEVQDRDGDLS